MKKTVYHGWVIANLENYSNNTEMARAVAKEFRYDDGKIEQIRRRISSIRKSSMKTGDASGIINAAERNGVDPTSIPYAWLKGDKEASLFVRNPLFEGTGVTVEKIEEALDGIIEKHKSSFKKEKFERKKLKEKKACKVTISDSHVGMNPNQNSSALFQYEYNADVYIKSMDKVFDSVIKEFNVHGTFDLLLLDDLGDLADGWNGYTTRGGHELPQNMSNAEVFEVCVDTKINLIRRLIEANVANKLIIRCVSNDNHSGDFSLIINKAIQRVINMMYNEKIVEVDILERFIEHRTYGEHCFVLTHGKDKEFMKSGLPIVLNDRAIRLITDYIEHYGINSKYIHVEKGDLHQIGYQRVKKFDYRNFMSFAPPSSWIQHNFGDSYSGYSIQIIPKHSNEIQHTDYFLDYLKK